MARIDITVATSGNEIAISVEDDGPGSPEERRADVLSGGFRLDRTVPGTGIGLAISSDLAILHGGHVEIEPSALGGTRIIVSIRVAA